MFTLNPDSLSKVNAEQEKHGNSPLYLERREISSERSRVNTRKTLEKLSSYEQTAQ